MSINIVCREMEENDRRIEELKVASNHIYNISCLDCSSLNIGDRVGDTGYIDFISPDEMNTAYNKGVDKYGRKFINILANIEYENGSVKKTLSTLFQRYKGDESLWVICGDKILQTLMESYGGVNIEQFDLIRRLLEEKSVDITEENYRKCRITKYNSVYCINSHRDDRNYPRRIYLETIQSQM